MEFPDFAGVVQSGWFKLGVVPLLIFLARVSDVTLGTLRMVFVSRGIKRWAALLGFFEVLIWLTAISYILQNLTGIQNYLAYAGGFAAGNFVGLLLEEKMASGFLCVTIITHRDAKRLIGYLRDSRFGVTSVSAMGATGRVRIIYSIIRRKDLEDLKHVVEELHPNAFISIQQVKEVSKELYPFPNLMKNVRSPISWMRKGK